MKYDELYALHSNFRERGAPIGEWKDNFSPPTLDEVVKNYRQDATLREKIEQMLDAGAVKRFYAAVLLWEIDRAKAKSVLEELENNSTPVEVQAQLGFKIVETSIGVLARDFLSEQQIRGSNFSREENLRDWEIAVLSEKRELKQAFDINSLPKWTDVLEARENADKMKKLRIEIDRLKNGEGIAEKFYAAALLDTIDEAESKKVLESLLAEKTEVGILSGDEMNNIPAYQVAESILNPEKFYQSSEPTNVIARATKWLEKIFFDDKSNDESGD